MKQIPLFKVKCLSWRSFAGSSLAPRTWRFSVAAGAAGTGLARSVSIRGEKKAQTECAGAPAPTSYSKKTLAGFFFFLNCFN